MKQHNLLQNTEHCNGWACHTAADLPIEATNKASKSAGMSRNFGYFGNYLGHTFA